MFFSYLAHPLLLSDDILCELSGGFRQIQRYLFEKHRYQRGDRNNNPQYRMPEPTFLSQPPKKTSPVM
jgi:hypothetical protein